MAHWKLTLSYNGSHFHGWQIQPGVTTVQGTLADALREITGTTLLPQGAGRTDAGVHALAQVASFWLPRPIPPANLQRALNRVMPPGVRVLAAEIVPTSFHARHSARQKLYEYRIFERRLPACPPAADPGTLPAERICSPFLSPFVWDCRWPLHFDRLQQAAQFFQGTHDFTALAATGRAARDDDDGTGPGQVPSGQKPRPASKPNPVKTIHSSTWTRAEGLLLYRVCGSGFLHHMVRNLVGTMVDIGRGSLHPEDVPRILASRDRSQAGPTAPASGLYLVEVGYDPLAVSAAGAPQMPSGEAAP